MTNLEKNNKFDRDVIEIALKSCKKDAKEGKGYSIILRGGDKDSVFLFGDGKFKILEADLVYRIGEKKYIFTKINDKIFSSMTDTENEFFIKGEEILSDDGKLLGKAFQMYFFREDSIFLAPNQKFANEYDFCSLSVMTKEFAFFATTMTAEADYNGYYKVRTKIVTDKNLASICQEFHKQTIFVESDCQKLEAENLKLKKILAAGNADSMNVAEGNLNEQ